MTLTELYENGYIQINNDWFRIRDGTNLIQSMGLESFYLLVNLLQRRTYKNTVCANKKLICDLFGGNRTEYTNKAYQALTSLIDNNIVELLEEVNLNKPRAEDFIEARINFPVVYEKDYCVLFNKHLQIINKEEGINNRVKLLSLYCAIKRRVFDEQCSYISNQILINETGIDRRLISKYVDILQDNKLIMYDNPGKRIINGEIKRSPNFYVVYSDEGNCEYLIEQAIKNYKQEQIKREIIFIGK